MAEPKSSEEKDAGVPVVTAVVVEETANAPSSGRASYDHPLSTVAALLSAGVRVSGSASFKFAEACLGERERDQNSIETSLNAEYIYQLHSLSQGTRSYLASITSLTKSIQRSFQNLSTPPLRILLAKSSYRLSFG